MMLLQDLSADLLLSIAYHLESGDHKNLRLVCNSLSDIFAVLVLNFIRIWIKGPVVDALSHLDLLIWLAKHHPSHKARIQAIRKLWIVSLSPANDAPEEALTSSFTKTEDQVVKYLKPALLALQNVHTFIWEVQAHDPVITHKIVAETTSSYPHLEKIHIYLTRLTSPVLHHFKNLLSIEYSSYTDQGETSFPRDLSDDFAQAILRSPRLSSFTFTAAEGQEYLFDHILDRCHPSAPNIRLHELVVHRITSLLPIYPLIQNLKVIEITDMDSTEGLSAEMLNNFWVAMREKKVQLEKISVDRVPGALVEYLKWHHGLKSFVLSNDGGYAVNGAISDDDVADEFYFSGLSNHLSTLEELDIHIFYEGKWCFRHDLAAVIGQCVSLKRLGLGFGHDDLLLGVRDGGKNTLHNLMDTTFRGCPHLNAFTVYNPPAGSKDIDNPDPTISYVQARAAWQLSEYLITNWTGIYDTNAISSTEPQNRDRRLPIINISGLFDLAFCYVPIDAIDAGFGTIVYQKRRI